MKELANILITVITLVLVSSNIYFYSESSKSGHSLFFDKCATDLDCYTSSFNHWSIYFGKENIKCGLLLVKDMNQLFVQPNDGRVYWYINYCYTDDELEKMFENMTYEKLEIFSVYGIDDYNYELSKCFHERIFMDEFDYVDKFSILNSCRESVRQQ